MDQDLLQLYRICGRKEWKCMMCGGGVLADRKDICVLKRGLRPNKRIAAQIKQHHPNLKHNAPNSRRDDPIEAAATPNQGWLQRYNVARLKATQAMFTARIQGDAAQLKRTGRQEWPTSLGGLARLSRMAKLTPPLSDFIKHAKGIEPNHFILSAVLSAYASEQALHFDWQAHNK
ncbi:hypothetical protein Cni_G02752 [Canna indica]|uniref:Uncharacterized protein n=1 Tax=Canna indica TaxID=4628 RepID=A0AAQ3Q0B2_9LILI|nr:hypothetical protein Cni_G02752 [Canna indica]